jgi:hypothetical protein
MVDRGWSRWDEAIELRCSSEHIFMRRRGPLTSLPFMTLSFGSLRSVIMYSPLPLRDVMSILPMPSRRDAKTSSVGAEGSEGLLWTLDGEPVILLMNGLVLER